MPSPDPQRAAQVRLEAALPAALERVRATPGVYAALWCGSAARGEANASSDLDLHVLVSGDQRWRSWFTVDGVPVEVFHNPARQVRAMFAAGDAATLAMYAQGRVVLPHPDLDALVAEARRVHGAGPAPRPVDDFIRFMLTDTVMDGRAAVDDPIHAQIVGAALGPLLVRPLYAAQGWWSVRPQHWLADLDRRAPDVAADLRAVLVAANGVSRQAAFEALARRVLGDLGYVDGQTEPQRVAGA